MKLVAGLAINPLQSLVKTYKIITIPYHLQDIRNATEGRGLLDIAHRFQPEIMNSSFGDLVARTRTKLSWTNTSDLQTRLWSHNMTLENCQDEGIKCWLQSTLMLSNMTHLDDFFWSQIYPGFGTGLVKQFVPQVNWTVKALYSSDTNFPQTCAGTGNTNKLPLRYSLQGPEGSLNLEFCMPGNSPKTTWRAQRHRQHLHEELFVRLDLAEDPSGLSPAVGKYMYQVILDTTAGYFELPNFMNGGFVSTLLNADPVKICSYAWDCLFQHSNSWNSTHQIPPNTTRMNDTSTIENRGPLLTIALALFGPGSFLNASDVQRQYDPDGREPQCGLRLPMAGLLQSLDSGSSPLDKIDLCYKANDAALQTAQAQFVTALFPDPIDGHTAAQKNIENAFNMAAFLANDVIMTYSPSASDWNLRFDYGIDVITPVMRQSYMVLMSVLLGFYLIYLVTMATYSARTRRWTQQMDAFALMRIGASRPHDFPLDVARKPDDVPALDALPGWIGERRRATEVGSGCVQHNADGTAHGRIGTLELGGPRPLQSGTLYPCYRATCVGNHDLKGGESEGIPLVRLEGRR